MNMLRPCAAHPVFMRAALALLIVGGGSGCRSDDEKLGDFLSRGQQYAEEGKNEERRVQS